MDRVKKHFESEAWDFDEIIRKRVPRYEDMIDTLIFSLPFPADSHPRILDIGCGTGTITESVKKRYPASLVTCIDLAENMISVAGEKLKGFAGIEYHKGDILDFKFGHKYDAIISSLTLHHIEDGSEKKGLYKRFYDNLTDGGVFYNADITLWSTKYLEKVYMDRWGDFMSKALTEEEVLDTFNKYHSEDRPFRLVEELEWLKQAGFRDIEVLWRDYNAAVYGGYR